MNREKSIELFSTVHQQNYVILRQAVCKVNGWPLKKTKKHVHLIKIKQDINETIT